MAPGANSYGTAAMVAGLSKRYTASGTYTAQTNPTSTQVEAWIDQVSGTVNVLLAEQGFGVPVTQADAKLAIEAIVVEAVTDLAHAANSAGRFFTDRALASGKAPMAVIRMEMAEWIQAHAQGFEAIGAGRNTGNAGGIGYRDGDDNGNEVDPLFGRNAFGADPRYGR
jgi:hypothetical protein